MELDPVLHLRYLAWATAEMLKGVKQLPREEYERDRQGSHGGIKGTLHHMFRADTLWFSRVSGEPFGNIKDVEVPNSLEELEREWLVLLERWQKWFRQLEANQLGIHVRYSNSQGAPCSTPLWQIVLHLVNHATHHRGQVIGMMRQAGVKPPITDLIVFYRLLEKQAAPSS
jgi:uncharacterized damage-inducible protein DinB